MRIEQLVPAEPGWKAVFKESDGGETTSRILGWGIVAGKESELVGVIVDSTEWPDLPASYALLAEIFDRVAVSDIAWARTSRWRPMLASLWPEIANVRTIRVEGTAAQACLLAGWLRSRLGREVELEHAEAKTLIGVDIDGEPAPFPAGDPPKPADQLSDELDRLSRDPVYEAAVAATI